MGLPSDNKNQAVRRRGRNDPAAFSRKPMLDENRNGGLRGRDKRQGALRDAKPPPARRTTNNL